MKKTSILIAALAVIAAAPAARAQNFDFDGKTTGTPFMEAVRAVEVSQAMKPVPEKIAWPQNGLGSICASAVMCSGMQYLSDDCTCKPLPGYEDFYNHISSTGWWAYAGYAPGADMPITARTSSLTAGPKYQAAVRGLAGYYPAQKGLRDFILAQFNVHDNFSSSIFQALHDEKSIIVYNAKGVYLANGATLYGTNNKELVRKVLAHAGNQTKFGLEDVAAAAVFGCLFSSECRDDVADYVNNLHDDEHDTYHNNHDGSDPDYEVNKKVK